MTLGEAAEYGAKELCGLKTPLADCEILLAFALSESRLFVKTHPERLLSQREEAAFREFVARRKNNCPIAYITGRKEFLGLELFAAPGALVPRPETELVAEEAARLLAGKKAPRVCDMGTGSGALAVGLGTLVAGCFVTACDVSAEALAVAEKNVKRFGLENRTELVLSDWFSALEGRRFDMIVSNPPYIPSAVIDTLEPCIKDYEPRTALDGGADGLDAYRILFKEGRRFLAPGGSVVCEIGSDQGETAPAVAKEAGFVCRVLKDYSGNCRIAVAEPEKER